MKLNNVCIKKLWKYSVTNKEIACITIEPEILKIVIYDNSEAKGICLRHSINLNIEMKSFTWGKKPELFHKLLHEIKNIIHENELDPEKMIFLVELVDIGFQEEIELPALSEKELEEALFWEIPQHIPWEDGSYEYRYHKKSLVANLEQELVQKEAIKIYGLENYYIEAITNFMKEEKLLLGALSIRDDEDSNDYFKEEIDKIDFYEGFYKEDKLEELRLEYHYQIALALKYLNSVLTNDFLTEKNRFNVHYNLLVATGKWISVGVTTLGIIITGFFWFREYYGQTELTEVQQKLQDSSRWEQRLEANLKYEKELEDIEARIKHIENSRINWSKLLENLSKLLPKGCWLTKIEQQEKDNDKPLENTIFLYGKTKNMTLLPVFIQNLKSNASYSKVEIMNSNLDNMAKDNTIKKFTLKITIGLPSIKQDEKL